MASDRRVCVVGSGVIGLSTGVHLQELGYEVALVSANPSGGPTSLSAAAFWYPFHVFGAESWWGEETWALYRSLVDQPQAGVRWVVAEEYFETVTHYGRSMDDCWWRHLRGYDLRDLPRGTPMPSMSEPRVELQAGTTFNTFVIRMAAYLPYLKRRFLDAGGRFVTHRFENVEEALDRDESILVNCTGVAAREFLGGAPGALPVAAEGAGAPGSGLYGEVGHIVLMDDCPFDKLLFIKDEGWFHSRPFYVVPLDEGLTAIGGTVQTFSQPSTQVCLNPQGHPELKPDLEEEGAKILKLCRKLFPEVPIDTGKLRGIRVGVRPVRNPVRVAYDPSFLSMRGTHIVHNYGHGGGGVTYSWGSAMRVAQILRHYVGTDV